MLNTSPKDAKTENNLAEGRSTPERSLPIFKVTNKKLNIYL